MEAKEKAKELVEKFKSFVDFTNDDFDTCIIATTKNAKQCALIAVDEITKALEEYGQQTMELQNMDREFAWWDKVKQEINNLTI